MKYRSWAVYALLVIMILGTPVSVLAASAGTEGTGTESVRDGSKDGKPVTGWKKISGNWYYFSGSGVKQTGWQFIDGKWYFFEENGAMHVGWLEQGATYYLNPDGAMAVGWKAVNGRWYHMDDQGVMQTGWQCIGDHWYYMNGNGIMQTGWQKIGGKWYYLAAGGEMATGFYRVPGFGMCYFDGTGAMATGSRVIDGKSYYFRSSGLMVDPYYDVAVKVQYVFGKHYSGIKVAGCEITGNKETVEITRPVGEETVLIGVEVNLETGYASCSGAGGYETWKDFFSKGPYSFNIR